jgi:hypothetical protein
MPFLVRTVAPSLLMLSLVACSSSDPEADDAPNVCPPHEFEEGDENGHPDPTGAKAAGQARASRIADAALIAQPEDRGIRVRPGDYLLINDKIAVYVEDGSPSDGYAPFGGEILAIDRVGDDGRPMGLSRYNETLLALSNEMVRPESVTVLADGEDGGEAVVRVVGRLEPIPIIEESLGVLFPRDYRLPVALDYVLSPGSEKLLVRLTLVNETTEGLDLSLDEMHAFFHYGRAQMATPSRGFDEPRGQVAHVEFDGGPWGFAWRSPAGPLYFALEQAGFAMFNGLGFQVEACGVKTRDHVEVIAGGPHLDGLRQAIRRVDGDDSFREVRGKVLDGTGLPVPGAWVHQLGESGSYVSRTKTEQDGSFLLHAPPSDVTLVPQKQGYPTHEGAKLPTGESTPTLSFAPHGSIRVLVSDPEDPRPLPVRIQVIPEPAPTPTPSDWGVVEERNGRLYQHFAIDGEATLAVPPGNHRVVVSRGYEYEIVDTTLSVSAGETVDLTAELTRSVDTAGWMCTDFHVHTFYSPDSNDPLLHKVAGAAADGLDIMTVSDHEWVTDPGPAVAALDLTPWMASVSSLELTTFTWGHFGVIPMVQRPDELNHGAVNWIGKTPAEVFDMVDALPEKPALVVNHPRSSGFGGYFSATGYDRATGTGRADLWSDNFDVIEVCNGSTFEDNRKSTVQDWFSFLERGKDIWAVGSSDNHHLVSGPVGHPRTCLHLGHDDPAKADPVSIRDALLAGRAIIGGGLFMTVKGPAGELPGQKFQAASGTATFTVSVQAPTWISATKLETIVNGVTVHTQELLPVGDGPGQSFLQTVEVPVDTARDRSWVVFHATGDGDLAPVHPGKKPFAFSNPVFFGP